MELPGDLLTVSFFYNKMKSNNASEGNENGKIRETDRKRAGARSENH